MARDHGRALGETGQQKPPSDSLFPSLRLGLGVAVPGGTGWQLLPPASGGRGGRSSQFQKSEGGGPAPDPDAACQDKRLLWCPVRGLGDSGGPGLTAARDPRGTKRPFWWATVHSAARQATATHGKRFKQVSRVQNQEHAYLPTLSPRLTLRCPSLGKIKAKFLKYSSRRFYVYTNTQNNDCQCLWNNYHMPSSGVTTNINSLKLCKK